MQQCRDSSRLAHLFLSEAWADEYNGSLWPSFETFDSYPTAQMCVTEKKEDVVVTYVLFFLRTLTTTTDGTRTEGEEEEKEKNARGKLLNDGDESDEKKLSALPITSEWMS